MRRVVLEFRCRRWRSPRSRRDAPSVPTTQPTFALPANWAQRAGRARATSPAASLDAWWRAFADPTLNELMEEAVAGNTDVASAKAKIREARATRREAGAALVPSLHGQRLGDRLRGRTRIGRRNDVYNHHIDVLDRRLIAIRGWTGRRAGSSTYSAARRAISKPRSTGRKRLRTICAPPC